MAWNDPTGAAPGWPAGPVLAVPEPDGTGTWTLRRDWAVPSAAGLLFGLLLLLVMRSSRIEPYKPFARPSWSGPFAPARRRVRR